MDDGDVASDPIPARLFQDMATWRRSTDHQPMLALRDSYVYQPESYLDCSSAPIVATLETGVGRRGYTVHLHLFQSNGVKGAILRLITANEGIGLDLCVLDHDVLAVRMIPEESEWTKLAALPLQWNSMTCVHVNIPKPVMHVYINGGHVASASVSYPADDKWAGQTLMTLLGGGYTGRIALCAIFGDPLPHRAVTFLHAVPINYQPHFTEQHSFSVMGFPITVTAAYPTGGGTFPELPRIDHVPGQMALFPRTLIYLSASSFSKASCDPLPFPNRSIDILQGVEVHNRCDLQPCFEAAGGLRLFLVAISPSFLGRRFVDAMEATAIVELLASLLRGCVSFAYDLAVMGCISLHKLIYSWIDAQHRVLNLLHATRSLLTAIDMIDITPSKHIFLDFFTTTLTDFAFWSDATDDCQRALSDVIIALVSPNPSVFVHAIGVEGFIHHFNYLQAKENETLSQCCLQCIRLISTTKDLPVLFRTVLALRNNLDLQNKFLLTLSKLAFEDSAAFRDVVLADPTLHFRALLMISSSTDDATSRIGLRLLGIVLVMIPTPLRSSMARSAALFIEENLRLNADVYSSVIQLLVGEITPGTAQSDNAAFHDEHVIQIPEILPALFSLTRASSDDILVDRVLMDILSIIKISDKNKMAFTRNPFWQRWVIPYCEDPSSVRSQIGLQILSAALLYCCCQEDKGWVSFDQTLWLLDANKHRPAQDIFVLKCALFLELVSQLSRSSSIEFGPDTSPLLLGNLKPTLQLIEWLLFESDQSALCVPDQPIYPDQLVLLERLLITALKFLPFPERREHIVRLVLRYIHVVLPRPGSSKICPVVLGAASQVFGLMLGEKNAVNLRVVQMAISFLKTAATTLHEPDFDCSLDVERVVQSLVHVWGTAVFTDLNQQAIFKSLGSLLERDDVQVEVGDPDRVSLLTNRDDGLVAAEINSSLPVILSDEQIVDISLETFNRLRSKFMSVVGNRIDKLGLMLGQYSNKVSETLATKQLSDVKAQNEFHQRLLAVVIPIGSAAPATLHAIQQRSAYLMSRSILALKRFRDAFEYSAERKHDGSYWKVDPTENPMRMRFLLKRDPSGDNHANASARPADTSTARVDVATLPAVIAAGTSEEDGSANETEEKSSTEWTHESAEEDEEPVGFNINRPGDASDDAVPVQVAQPLLVVNCTLISLTRKIDGEFTVFGDGLQFVGKQEHRTPGESLDRADVVPADADPS